MLNTTTEPQTTTMRSAKSMMEVETPRNQSSLLSLTLILPSFSAHLVSKRDKNQNCVEPFCEGGCKAEQVDDEAENSSIVEIGRGSKSAQLLIPE